MTFLCTGTGLLRAARIPLSQPLPDTPADLSDTTDMAPWRTWLARTWREPTLAEAVRAASPDLTRAVEGILATAEAPPAEVRKVSTSLLRYALRSRYRATPLGLFALTAPAHLGTTCMMPLHAEPSAVARPDARWLSLVLDQLHSDPDVLTGLRVSAEPTRRVEGDEVVVPYKPAADIPDQVRSRLNTPLRLLLEATARPVPVAQAARDLQTAFPSVHRSTIISLIGQSIRAGLLHSDLTPSCLDPFPLRHILARLDVTPAAHSALSARLRQIDDLLSVSEGSEQAGHLMRELADPGVNPVMLDLHSSSPVVIPQHLADDVAAALDVMARISEHPGGSPGWQNYRRRFFERYSLGTLVPVLELTDPVNGLGYPPGFLGSTGHEPDQGPTKRDGYLLIRLQQVLMDGAQELVLDQDDITALQRGPDPALWPSAEVTVAVHAPSTAAIDRREYRLLIEGMGAAAGVFTGRFMPLMDQNEQARVVAAHRSLPTLDGQAIRVQVCSPALRTKAQNLGRTIQLVPEVLAVGEYAEQATLHLADLAVTATADRLCLIHVPTGRPVEPFMATAVNQQDATDPMARFLLELPRSHAAVLSPFVWGQTMKDLPFLPRLRFGRVILAPARWHVTASRLGPEPDPADAVQTWRRRWHVPAIVSAGGSDQRLRLNLDDPVHRRLLADMITARTNPLRVQEAAPDHAHGWLGHAGQITLSFAAVQAPPTPSRTLTRTLVNHRLIRWPGTASTVLLRIDTDTTRTGQVFAAGLADLLDNSDDVHRWWFTRYRDPQPHLRVRITVQDAHQFGDLAARVAQWAAQARMIRAISWHSDLPETGRYGTSAVLAAAEAFFAADSRAALAQDAPGRAPHERQALLVASLLDITRHLHHNDLEALHQWDNETIRGHAAPGFDRRARTLAMNLWSTRENGFTALAGGPLLEQIWHARARALSDYCTSLHEAGHHPQQVLPALLHMHHIRAHGLDAEHEDHVQRCVRELAHSLLARAMSQAKASA